MKGVGSTRINFVGGGGSPTILLLSLVSAQFLNASPIRFPRSSASRFRIDTAQDVAVWRHQVCHRQAGRSSRCRDDTRRNKGIHLDCARIEHQVYPSARPGQADGEELCSAQVCTADTTSQTRCFWVCTCCQTGSGACAYDDLFCGTSLGRCASHVGGWAVQSHSAGTSGR